VSQQSPIGKCFKIINLKKEKNYNEIEMILAFQRGAEKGFDFFFRQLFPSLCFFANRMLNSRCEAEDIASNAFIKIWKKHPQFNNANSIRSYLYTIVRNDCLTCLQQKKRTATLHGELEYLTIVDLQDNREADIIRAEFYAQLYEAINSLPPACGKIFTMLYIQGKSVKEISKELNLSPSTIKTQRARGLIVLRKKIVPLSCIFFLLLFL
jgi:RNA polymerase sigma-70 factor, ECF subfamily